MLGKVLKRSATQFRFGCDGTALPRDRRGSSFSTPPVRGPVLLVGETELGRREQAELDCLWLPEARRQELFLGVLPQHGSWRLEDPAGGLQSTWSPVGAFAGQWIAQFPELSDRGILWFEYLPPSEKSMGPFRLKAVAADQPKEACGWVWSGTYQSWWEGGKTIRTLATFLAEPGSCRELHVRWSDPVELLWVAVDGRAVFRGPKLLRRAGSNLEGRRLANRQRAVGFSGDCGRALWLCRGSRRKQPEKLCRNMSSRWRAARTLQRVDLLWQEPLQSGGISARLRVAGVTVNLPVLESRRMLWLPPGWQVDDRLSIADFDFQRWLERLFGRLARPPEQSVFDPFSPQTHGSG